MSSGVRWADISGRELAFACNGAGPRINPYKEFEKADYGAMRVKVLQAGAFAFTTALTLG